MSSAISPGKSLKSSIDFTVISSPVLSAIIWPFSLIIWKTPEPIVPYPNILTLIIFPPFPAYAVCVIHAR